MGTFPGWVKQFHWPGKPWLSGLLPSWLAHADEFSCGGDVHLTWRNAVHRFRRQMASRQCGYGCGWSGGLNGRNFSCRCGTGKAYVRCEYACGGLIRLTWRTSLGRFPLDNHRASHLEVCESGPLWGCASLLSEVQIQIWLGALSVEPWWGWVH